MTHPPRILIVEADVLARHPLAEYLRECGYRVVEARDGEEARVLLNYDNLPVDIVLAEGSAGLEIAAYVKANFPNIKLIRAGSVNRATEKAGSLCEDGPAPATPYEHKFVLERIRRLTAARDRALAK